jgi:arabinose-5-phosphate isomerase
VFIHPVEGLHGDIGIVTKKDLLLAISKSGHSGELVKFIQSYKRLGGVAVAVTEGLKSPMARLCDMILPLPKLPEADEMDLAPTTSTTVTLALGDAIAVTLLWLRGFGPQDFAKYHPDGTLGRRLLLCARDLMHADEKLPVVTTADTMKVAIGEITSKGLGVTCVVDDDGKFVGTITDGDLRRLMEKASNMLSLTTGEALDLSRRKAGPVGPFTVGPETPAIECREIMNKYKIKDLVVLQNDTPVGVVRIYEITAAGL